MVVVLAGGDSLGAALGLLLTSATGGTAPRDVLLLRLMLSEHLGRHRAHDDRDVTGALADLGRTSTGSRAEPVERLALVGETGRHVEALGIEFVVVGGVGDGRVEQTTDDLGGVTIAELEDVVRRVGREPPDEVEHHPGLLRGHPDVADRRPGARTLVGLDAERRHQRLPVARSWPAWNRKVRVGANSPSLCPTIASVM